MGLIPDKTTPEYVEYLEAQLEATRTWMHDLEGVVALLCMEIAPGKGEVRLGYELLRARDRHEIVFEQQPSTMEYVIHWRLKQAEPSTKE